MCTYFQYTYTVVKLEICAHTQTYNQIFVHSCITRYFFIFSWTYTYTYTDMCRYSHGHTRTHTQSNIKWSTRWDTYLQSADDAQVCCCVVQRGAAWCRVWQRVAACGSVLYCVSHTSSRLMTRRCVAVWCSSVQFGAVCCSVCVAVCGSVLQCVLHTSSRLMTCRSVAVCCSVVQCVAACCSALQRVAACGSVFHIPLVG